MKTVIRVQDKYGRGMFQFGNESNVGCKSVYDIPSLQKLAERHDEFPTAITDDVIDSVIRKPDESIFEVDYENLKWRFAFKNISQFEEWVLRKEVLILKKHGYKVYKIEAETVVESEYQSVYDINSVVNITDITDLFLD